jgi:hypothetical protein
MSYMNTMHIAAILLSALLLAAGPIYAEETLKPFTTDGCSEFPNGTLKQKDLWLKCCIAHDKKYWAGGTQNERLVADRELKVCVESVGEPAIAALMLAGVRVGGSPALNTPFRWGYGWPFGRGYKALSPEENAQVRKLLEQYEKQSAVVQ